MSRATTPRPKLALCSNCPAKVATTCMGMCPRCFAKWDKETAVLAKRENPAYKDLVFDLNVEIDRLRSKNLRVARKLERIIVMKGTKKDLVKKIDDLLNLELNY